MSNYGIEIFNSLGELVFSSEKRTARVLKRGTVDLGFGPKTVLVEFDPVAERPQVYANVGGGNTWCHNVSYIQNGRKYNQYHYNMTSVIGRFRKNEQGLYYAIGFSNSYLNQTPFQEILGSTFPGSNTGDPLDNIPYVIFV